MKLIIKLLLPFALATGLVACSDNISPNTYTAGEINSTARVERGTVLSERQVKIDNSSQMGGAAGVVGGGIAGSAIGGGGRANALGALAGAVLGGVAGNAIDKGIHSDVGFEYMIQISKNRIISVVQDKDLQLSVGQRVMVIYGKDKTRIVPDTTA